MSDEEYVWYVAAVEYAQVNLTISADESARLRFDVALRNFVEGDRMSPISPKLPSSDGDSTEVLDHATNERYLNDTEVLFSWLTGVLDGVIGSDSPFLGFDGGLHECYLHEMSLADRINCFQHCASLEGGVLCGEITIVIRENEKLEGGTSFLLKIDKLEKCAKGVHSEVMEFKSRGSKRVRPLAEMFMSCWRERWAHPKWIYTDQHMRQCGLHTFGNKTVEISKRGEL